MYAFAIESYGSLGNEAQKLLKILAGKSDEVSGHAFLQHACASISVALQAGNAAIAFGGLQRLRVEQLTWDLPMSLGLHGHSSRRRSARHAAHIRHGELDFSAAFHASILETAGGALCAGRVSNSAA